MDKFLGFLDTKVGMFVNLLVHYVFLVVSMLIATFFTSPITVAGLVLVLLVTVMWTLRYFLGKEKNGKLKRKD